MACLESDGNNLTERALPCFNESGECPDCLTECFSRVTDSVCEVN